MPKKAPSVYLHNDCDSRMRSAAASTTSRRFQSGLRSLSLLPTRGQDELLIKEVLRRGQAFTPEPR